MVPNCRGYNRAIGNKCFIYNDMRLQFALTARVKRRNKTVPRTGNLTGMWAVAVQGRSPGRLVAKQRGA